MVGPSGSSGTRMPASDAYGRRSMAWRPLRSAGHLSTRPHVGSGTRRFSREVGFIGAAQTLPHVNSRGLSMPFYRLPMAVTAWYRELP
jgi:hypothetical protein